jgi:hypothetical protein
MSKLLGSTIVGNVKGQEGVNEFSLRMSKLLGSTIVGNAGGEGLGLYGKHVKNAGEYDLTSGKPTED